MEQFLLLSSSKYEDLLKRLDGIENLLKDIRESKVPIQGWLTEAETQKFLGVGATTLWSLRKRSKLEYSKIGSRIFYTIKSVERLLEKSKA